jgi:hypothetical protein
LRIETMTDIWLSGVVTEDHELIVKVPEDVSPGRVNVLLQTPQSDETIPTNPAREAARAKLAAAGLLSTAIRLPPGTVLPTEEEVKAAGILPPGARPSEDLINEDREERI